jgi:hypothetical protein
VGPELAYLLLARLERVVARMALRDRAALGVGDEASVIVADAMTPAHRGA